ncbi:14-3-3-like protein 16R [Artemisia annua]|uniref:14-3-3-like protein 16R n=1 Tax=Artemisia annua TaxID=35608 RepID=A0A2U1N2Z2_ARTAN|nr:14-3-3-like protein 16R [Artemisia annua]
MASSARQEQLCMAKHFGEAELYDDMLNSMTKLISELSQTEEVTEEESRLMIIACKNVLGVRRNSWRTIFSIEQEEVDDNATHAKWAKEYRCKIESEINEICIGVLKLLDDKLLVGTKCSGESKVTYLKMKGDCYRYLAEGKVGDEKKQIAECALNAYKSAQDIAYAELSPLHPTYLLVAVSFSIFYYEILNMYDRACSVAQQAYDEGMTELVELEIDGGSCKDEDVIFQILRLLTDNLNMWKFDRQKQEMGYMW